MNPPLRRIKEGKRKKSRKKVDGSAWGKRSSSRVDGLKICVAKSESHDVTLYIASRVNRSMAKVCTKCARGSPIRVGKGF